MHAEPRGLQPGREYFYRFRANGEISPVGRTKTAPAGAASAMAFAFASCQQYEHGYFTAYKHMAQDDLDLVIHLGDYIYEYDTNSYTATGGNARANSNHEIVNLADYRERHAQYKTDPDLQAAHGAFPWLVTFDDHEIDNNWASDTPEDGLPQDVYFRRRAAAFRAYWEHMPLRKAQKPNADGIQIYKRNTYGNLATFHVMDTRQFRSDQACGDGTRAGCDDRSNPARTLVGAQQEQWLYDGLQQSPGQVADPGPAGLHGRARRHRRCGRELQHGRLGRLQGLARQAAGLHRDAADRQPARDHGRRAPELGQQPPARLRRRATRRSSARSSSARRSRPPATAATAATPAR